jgi:transposase
MKKNYSSNPTDNQYETMLGIICDTRKCRRSLKEIFDAISYLLKTGCQWRELPEDFPPGRRCITTFANGAGPGLSKKFTIICGDGGHPTVEAGVQTGEKDFAGCCFV